MQPTLQSSCRDGTQFNKSTPLDAGMTLVLKVPRHLSGAREFRRWPCEPTIAFHAPHPL